MVDQIKKMRPNEALEILSFMPKKSSPILKKVISSAIFNAKNNANLTEESLTFKEISIGKGMTFKRFRPVARGRAHPILKRTSTIKVVLEGRKNEELKKQESQIKEGDPLRKQSEASKNGSKS